jgi:hypothetical protein
MSGINLPDKTHPATVKKEGMKNDNEKENFNYVISER